MLYKKAYSMKGGLSTGLRTVYVWIPQGVDLSVGTSGTCTGLVAYCATRDIYLLVSAVNGLALCMDYCIAAVLSIGYFTVKDTLLSRI